MKNKSQLKAGVVLSYLQTGLGMIISLAYTPVMLRILGQNEYGIYQTAASVISYLGLLSFGFGSSYMRFYARFKAAEDETGLKKLNGLFLTVYGGASALSLIAGFVLLSFPREVFGEKFSESELQLAQTLMFFMVISMALSFIDSVFSMYITAHEKFVFQRVLSLITTVLNPMITLPLLLMGFGSIALTAVSFFVSVASFIANITYAKRLGIAFSLKNPDFSLLKEIAVFSFFIFITSVAGQLNYTIDKYLLARFVGPDAVSVYDIGNRFNTYLMTLSGTVSIVFIPRINKIVAQSNDNRVLSELMIKVGRIQFFVVALVFFGFCLVGRYFIGVYAGEGYEQSYIIAVLLMGASFIPYIQNIGIEIQKAKNKHIIRSIVFFVIAVFNVLVSIPLIFSLGIKGAALGSALALIAGNTIFMNFYYKKGIGLDMKLFWCSMLRPVAAAAAAFLPCLAVTQFFPVDRMNRFLIVGVLFVLLYATAVWFIGANADEKQMVQSFLKNIKNILVKKKV